MTIIIDGTNGISGVDGSAGTPAYVGNDSDTGLWYPAANTVALSTSGSERLRIDSGGNVGIGTNTTTDGGVTITTSVTRDSSWDAKLALQSTVATDFPALFFSGCSSTSRYGGIIQTASTSGNTPAQITAVIGFENTSSTACSIVFLTNGNFGTSNAAERMRILSTGNILCLAGGNTSATGTGIAFPASQSDSSDANTLDDYEEGTWTPVGNGVTYSTADGSYTKIGRVVTARFTIVFPSTGSGSLVRLSGLPFTSTSSGTNPTFGGFLSYSTHGSGILVQILDNTSVIQFDDLSSVGIQNSTLSTKSFRGVVVYFV